MISEEGNLLAGEYVLGSLDPSARALASARRLADPDFATAVERWEARLLPLEEGFSGVEPPAAVWPAVLEGVRGVRRGREPSGAVVIRLERRLRAWRRTAQAVAAIAAVLALWVGILSVARGPGAERKSLIAVLQPADQQPAFLVRANLDGGALAVDPVAPQPAPGRSFELWLIDPSLPGPRSLGVLNPGDASRAALPPLPREVIARATYAVTVEQAGGSPTGRPTGAPLYLGHLVGLTPP